MVLRQKASKFEFRAKSAEADGHNTFADIIADGTPFRPQMASSGAPLESAVDWAAVGGTPASPPPAGKTIALGIVHVKAFRLDGCNSAVLKASAGVGWITLQAEPAVSLIRFSKVIVFSASVRS